MSCMTGYQDSTVVQQWLQWHAPLYWVNLCIMIAITWLDVFELTKDTPYLTLRGEVSGVCGKENLPCYNSTILYFFCSPELTYRDVNYLLVQTSRIPYYEQGYISNGAGHEYHPNYGFGTIDCSAMATEAKHWHTVPPLAKSSFDAHDRDMWVQRIGPCCTGFILEL